MTVVVPGFSLAWGRQAIGDRLACRSGAVVRFPFVEGGNNSVVECDLAKVEVAGSNPVSRSIYLIRALSLRDAHLCLRRFWRLGVACCDIT